MWSRRLLAVAALATVGCEWFSTMADTASIQPHEAEPIPAPEHAVPIGGLAEYDLATADQVLSNPRPGDGASVASGAEYYRVYCYVCHGPDGRGAGPISRVFPAIPPINTARVAGYTDPYVFALISKGRGLMPEYGRIPRQARWDLVNYLRTLPAGATTAPATAAPAGTGGAADTTAAGGGT